MTECEYYQQLISQRLDGELTAAQEHELAEHLSRCADCRAVDAAFRALSEGFADSAEDAPADLCENVMGEIRRENIRKTNKRGSKRTWRSLLATAACFALICAAAATALPMLARSNASTAAAQSADTANETDGSGADAAMPADAAPAEEPESAAEQRAKADRSMLYTMESASEAGAASYNVSADELLRRFVRGDASRNTEGSGLGLSIAQSLAVLMHGKLSLTVDGDLFKAELSLPLAEQTRETAPEKPE